MKKIIFTIASVLFICQMASALDMDVCGVQIGTKLTKEQVIAKFGKPTSYERDKSYYYYDENLNEKPGVHECYTYGDSRFDVTNDLGLHHFSIYSKDFPILTKKVDAGGIRVGQKASVLEKYHLEGEKAIDFSNEYSRKIGGEWYYYDNPSSPTTDVFMVLIKDGIIYGFMYSTIIW